jgi:hypothetical protein
MNPARCACVFSFCAIGLSACGGGDKEPGTGRTACEFSRSAYRGDCLALEAPPPSDGFQLHFGPRDYADQAELSKYVLAPGQEVNLCSYMTTPNDEDFYFSGFEATMRGGSHHMIVFGANADDPSIPRDGELKPCEAFPGLQFHFIVGAQSAMGPDGGRLKYKDVDQAPENSRLAYVITPKTRIAYQLHYINMTQEPILMESWVNIPKRPKESVDDLAVPLWWIGGLGMNVAPGASTTVKARCKNSETAPGPRRLISMVGHAHAHTRRITAWKVPAGSSERQLVYQEFNWEDATQFFYNSVTKNPQTNPEQSVPGASSGPLVLEPGDAIEWECHVQNTLNEPLTFGNEAYNSEMCNIFGSATPGDGLPWSCAGNQ